MRHPEKNGEGAGGRLSTHQHPVAPTAARTALRSQTTVPRANDESHSAGANDPPNQPSRSTEADRPRWGVLQCGVTRAPTGGTGGPGFIEGRGDGDCGGGGVGGGGDSRLMSLK